MLQYLLLVCLVFFKFSPLTAEIIMLQMEEEYFISFHLLVY